MARVPGWICGEDGWRRDRESLARLGEQRGGFGERGLGLASGLARASTAALAAAWARSRLSMRG